MKKLITILALTLTFSMNATSQDVYIPNAFTPNGDGHNDVWRPVFDDTLTIKQYNLEIYDGSGTLIFSTMNPEDGWNGLPFDTVYVYKFYMKCEGFADAVIKTGSITSIH
jgi:gliding motility-associated-like protein